MSYATVEGKVSRVFYEGKGAEVIETFTARGKEISKRWTAWFEAPHGLREGDVVKVSGIHGDEVDKWQKDGEERVTVKRSISRSRVLVAPSGDPVPEFGNLEVRQPADDVPF